MYQKKSDARHILEKEKKQSFVNVTSGLTKSRELHLKSKTFEKDSVNNDIIGHPYIIICKL